RVSFPQGCLKGVAGFFLCVDFPFPGFRSFRFSSSVWLILAVVSSTIFPHNGVIHIPYFVSPIISAAVTT
ncbi:hypothetical protein, partial [Vibrio parahaemolyticus]|uniref:hypothetical protein n=1 Tax=Vibrio parahaemolyticus TaxID=670 RepID=UPI001111F0B2